MASFYLRICTRASTLIRRSLHTAGLQHALPYAAADPYVWSRPVTIPLGRLSPCLRSRMGLSTEASSPSEGLILSNNFVKRMQEIHNEDGTEAPKKMLRLTVESGGCSGFQYLFSLDDTTRSDDRIFEKDGVKLVIDDISYNFVKGATVDFSEELIRSSFMVTTNPNAATGCGCGASFTVKG